MNSSHARAMWGIGNPVTPVTLPPLAHTRPRGTSQSGVHARAHLAPGCHDPAWGGR